MSMTSLFRCSLPRGLTSISSSSNLPNIWKWMRRKTSISLFRLLTQKIYFPSKLLERKKSQAWCMKISNFLLQEPKTNNSSSKPQTTLKINWTCITKTIIFISGKMLTRNKKKIQVWVSFPKTVFRHQNLLFMKINCHPFFKVQILPKALRR